MFQCYRQEVLNHVTCVLHLFLFYDILLVVLMYSLLQSSMLKGACFPQQSHVSRIIHHSLNLTVVYGVKMMWEPIKTSGKANKYLLLPQENHDWIYTDFLPYT